MTEARHDGSPGPVAGGAAAPAALAVIPARGGSKRLPRKNVLPLAGRPLLEYTVNAALGSGAFERIVVSTDDDEIAAVARAAGAEVLSRPAALADDHTPASEVTLAALTALGGSARYPVIAQLMPNCPLRDANDVRSSAAAFAAANAAFQVSVAPFGYQVAWWAMTLAANGELEPLFPEALKRRSQDLPPSYCPSGAIWWAKSAALETARTFYGPGVRGEPLTWEHAIDIDEEADLQLAAVILRGKFGRQGQRRAPPQQQRA